jgi:hypothetical protein
MSVFFLGVERGWFEMERSDAVAATQERFAELGGLLSRMAERPDLIEELDRAFAADDVDAFRRALDLGGFGPPPDKCNPYVTVYVKILRPPKLVERCRWVPTVLTLDDSTQLAEQVRPGIDADRLTELLKRLGLIVCEWVWEDQDEVIKVDKFVQGMCPPGSF